MAMTAIDQAEIDKILASAEADTPEGRLEKLEKEVELLKGSIKKLLIDIRETMNNLENPFQNLQSVAEFAQKPQQIQHILMPPEEAIKEEKEEEEEEEIKDLEKEKTETKKEEPEIIEEEAKEKDLKTAKGVPKQEQKTEKTLGFLEEKEKWDIELLFDLMSWLRNILDKYDSPTVKMTLEIFEKAGYISSETKNFILELSEFVSANRKFEELIFEFYKLHKLLEPRDSSMDSKLLKLLLGRKL